MRGLIYKDIITIRKELLICIPILVFYTIIAYINQEESIILYMVFIFVFLSILPATLFAYDERKDWNTFICATPMPKQKIVGCKYVLYLLIMLAVIIYAIFPSLFFLHRISFHLMVTMASFSIIFSMIQFPIYYQFGVERGRMITMAMVFLPMILLLFLNNQVHISLDSITAINFNQLPYYTGPVAVIFTLLSFRLSLGIYRNRER